MATLWAISDLHLEHPENRAFAAAIRPAAAGDWLIVCGDVADSIEAVESALESLAEHFQQVIWVPGNHELLTQRDEAGPRGEARYRALVEICRGLGVLTPEDPFAVWEGPGGPALIAPLFLLYDYSFGRNVAASKEEALRLAHAAGVVCVDEYLLHPDPYPSREAWCEARLTQTEARLSAAAGLPTVLVNHFPLLEAPTRILRHPEFAQWCGTLRTGDWHRRFGAEVVVYGHLHVPVTTWHDGTRFEEVSLGYPREWRNRTWAKPGLRPILGEAPA